MVYEIKSYRIPLWLVVIIFFLSVFIPTAHAESIRQPADANSVAAKNIEKAVTTIKIVDENGVPVADAVIVPDGLRTRSGHGGWVPQIHGPIPEITTDAQGIAKLQYPVYAYEKIKTEEISFKVNHQQFCPARPFWPVDREPSPIVLKRGATVKVSAYIGSKDKVVKEFFPQVSSKEVMLDMSYWKKNDDGALTTKQLSPGPHYLRAVYFPKDGTIYFSDPIYFKAAKGQTYTFDLDLKPGVRVDGKLDDSVPRPVKNGYIVAKPFQADQEKDASSLYWQTWRNIKEDGTFVVESLPPGQVDIIAICDGFVSKDPNKPLAMIRNPQIFTLSGDRTRVEILMELAADCKVTVERKNGKPIQNARIWFSPNVGWTGDGTQIFASRGFNSEEFFLSGKKFDFSKITYKNYFNAETEANGVAIVKNLPPQQQDFCVEHPDYEMPIQKTTHDESRWQKVNLSAGKTTSVTVTMQKKGTQMLGEESLIASYWRRLTHMFGN